MTQDPHSGLSAREREMMDIVHQLGEATAQDVRHAMEEPPTDATVRSTLRILEEKGWVVHRREAARFIYKAVASPEGLRKGVLQHVIRTFFNDSPADLVAAIVDRKGSRLRAGERERIRELLAVLDKRGKNP